jgi:outer membrane immunogenic protein
MRYTKLLLNTAIASIGFMSTASAADMPAPYTKAPVIAEPAYDWSGFYIGINGGYGIVHDCLTNTSILGVPTVPGVSAGCNDASGGMVGGQFGYRWQVANWVFGVEGQGDWADLSGSSLSIPGSNFTGVSTSNQSNVDAIGLITGQVGYAWDNTLLYLKGGAAATHDKYTGVATGLGFDQADETRWGGAIGAGIEVGFAQNWSVGLEYDHLFMGTHSLSFFSPQLPGNTRTDSIGQDADIVTVRVNYRFGGPVMPRY